MLSGSETRAGGQDKVRSSCSCQNNGIVVVWCRVGYCPGSMRIAQWSGSESPGWFARPEGRWEEVVLIEVKVRSGAAKLR